MPIDLVKLLHDKEIGDALGYLCDIEIQDDPKEPLWFTVDGSQNFTVLARDGGGGVYFTVAGSPRINYVSSEGEAGVMGSNVDEFLALVVGCPYWHDLLKFSSGGNLDEMRRALPVLEANWLDEDDDNEAMRAHLAAAIGVTPPDDIAGVLHRNIMTAVKFAHATDGSVLQPLFGSFTVERNPMLKPYLD